MKGYRIQIIKAKLDSYWYSTCTGNTYWAVLEEKDDHQDYRIIIEGILPIEGLGKKYVDFDDAIVLKVSTISIDTSVTVKVIEISND